jgi:hypothetical protein
LIASAALPAAALAKPRSRSFLDFAPRPPLGWNSWDSFGATLNETQAREIAAIMAKRLLPHGYAIFTVDIQWYEPGATGFEYRKDAPLTMDEWGRLLPAPNRFPSSARGGFRLLADYVHSLGLRFGVHLMRGIPRQAAEQRLPIRRTRYTADQIADRVNVCEWNSDMYGIDMSKPGAQAYYDSVFQLLAEWHVDFVKVDDISRPYERNRPEVEAVRNAIDRCGRPMVLSFSPGETPLTSAAHVRSHANMWRISDDFWDHWPALVEQFERLARWAPYRRLGAWPDADMLPLGLLDLGKRHSNFTRDEQYTLMTLWSIARSPLIMGGDLRSLDDFTASLLTNDEVLAVDQRSDGNRQLWRRDDLVAWTANDPQSQDRYLALFNLRDASEGAQISVPLAELNLGGPVRVRDLWQRQWIGTADKEVTATLPPHGAALFLLH